jgi:cyclopropane-fatty-acyl-phospholipid synthase
MSLIDAFLTRAIRRGELTVTLPGGTTKTYGKPDPALPSLAITFHDRRVLLAIVRDPGLGLGEGFMDGRVTIERGDILSLIDLATGNERFGEADKTLDQTPLRQALGRLRQRWATRNAALRAKRNVAHHYDLSARLYDLFLDADRQYSCAYFTRPDETLEQAQLDKKAHIAAKLALTPDCTVLDIGCGWGGLALYLHRVSGAAVTGITLSEEQLKIARERAAAAGVADKVRFELIDYRALGERRFDRIVSVGMLEHVGQANFRTYFRTIRDLLAPDGVALVHTIGRAEGPGYTDAFTDKYIFPGGYIPGLSELIAANDGLAWYVSDVETLRLHYAYTLKAWYDRTVAAKEQVVALYDERFYRMWTFYLAGAWASFANGQMVNYQIQFCRTRSALPLTRDYMLEDERRLRAREGDGLHASALGAR